MRALPTVVASRCGVGTLEELLDAGWTRDAVRHALETGRLERVGPSRFAPPPPATLNSHQQDDLRLLRRTIAATLPGDRVAVSHLGAGLLRLWPVWAADPRPCVATWDPRVRRVAGMHLHRIEPRALVRQQGIAVTSAARTVVDIAREFGPAAGLVSGDAALRRGDVRATDVLREAGAARGLAGAEHALVISGMLDPYAESPLESRSRWCMHVHGVERPQSQMRIHTREGAFIGRVDHFWEEGVVGEADGTLKYLDPRRPLALDREKERQERLADLDLEVVRWGAKDLRDFSRAAARIERARARARRKLVDGPPRWVALPSARPDVHDRGPSWT